MTFKDVLEYLIYTLSIAIGVFILGIIMHIVNIQINAFYNIFFKKYKFKKGSIITPINNNDNRIFEIKHLDKAKGYYVLNSLTSSNSTQFFIKTSFKLNTQQVDTEFKLENKYEFIKQFNKDLKDILK